jgi:hypothetical protein
VAENRSTEPSPRLGEPARRLRRLNADERLALVGVAVMIGSLLLPWWGAPPESNLVVTGIGEFGFAEAALVATSAAILFLIAEIGGGYVPPRPLREWALLVAGGAWSAAIITYRMFDRPDFTLGGADQPYHLQYGIMFALAGAALVVAAGLRCRELSDR